MLPLMRRLAVVVLLLSGCQIDHSSPGKPADRASAAAAGPSVVAGLTHDETDALCNAVVRSGASADAEENRNYLIADWLGKQIVSDTGRAWMAGFAQLGQDKAARRAALTRAARSAGLPSCPLVEMWQ